MMWRNRYARRYAPQTAYGMWRDMNNFHRTMEFIFGGTRGPVRSSYPLINAWSGDEGVKVTVELPGVLPEDIEITVDSDTLTISGNRSSDTEDGAGVSNASAADADKPGAQTGISASSASSSANNAESTGSSSEPAVAGELIDSPELENGDSTVMGGGAGGRRQIEQRQAVQQWLRDIPDNPAELLRRKFLYQHLQQNDGRPR